MSYRTNSDTVISSVNDPIEIHILNGTSTEISIPCEYEVDGAPVPIDLVAEGYTDPTLAIDYALDGFTWTAVIDPVETNTIKLTLNAVCPSALDADATRDISLLITADKTIAIIRGKLVVVASPLAV